MKSKSKNPNGYAQLMDLAPKDYDKAYTIACKIPPEKLEIVELLPFYISENLPIQKLARELLNRIPKEMLNRKQLLRLQNNKDKRIRNFLRDLLLKHFSGDLDYKALIGFYKDSQGTYYTHDNAEKALLALPKEKLSIHKLAMLQYTKSAVDYIWNITTRLLLKHFAAQLSLKTILGYKQHSQNNNRDITDIIWKAALAVRPEELDFELILSHHPQLDSYHSGYYTGQLLLKIPRIKLSLKRLRQVAKEDKEATEYSHRGIIAAKLLLIHFPEQLSLKEIQGFEAYKRKEAQVSKGESEVAEMARQLLLKRFPETLDLLTLLKIMETPPGLWDSHDTVLNRAVTKIALKIPAEKLDLHFLLKLQMSDKFPDSQDSIPASAYKLIGTLLEKVPIKKVDFEEMAAYFQRHACVSFAELILRLPKERFESERLHDLYEKTESDYGKGIWCTVLMKHFPEEVSYKMLIELQNCFDEDIRESARQFALTNGRWRPDIGFLIAKQQSENIRERELAAELALLVPNNKLNLEDIVALFNNTKAPEKYEEEAWWKLILQLVEKIPLKKLNRGRLLEMKDDYAQTNDHVLRHLATIILEKRFKEKIESEEDIILKAFSIA